MLDTWPDYEDPKPAPRTWRKIAWELFCMACLGALLGAAIAPLVGCATAEDAEVCYVKPLGNTDTGMIVVLQQCMTPEAFQKTQE